MKSTLCLISSVLPLVAFPQAPRQKVDGPLSLSAAVALAIQNSPSLTAAQNRVKVALGEVRSARSALAPQLSANSFATSGSYSTIYPPSPSVGPPYWLADPRGEVFDQNLMLMLPIFTGGRLGAVVRSATWEQRAAEAEAQETRAEVVLSVREAYLGALVARQIADVQGAQVAADQELLRTKRAEFQSGKGIEASVSRVQAELSHAQRGLTTAQNDASKAILDLEEAVGIDYGSSVRLTDQLTLTQDVGTLDSYLTRATTSRGTVVAAKARIEGLSATVHAAEAQFSPQLYAQAMADVSSPRNGAGASFGLTLSLPIFDGGRISADVSAAKARRATAQSELDVILLSVEKEVRQAWLDLDTAKANAASAQASVVAAQQAYDVVALRVAAGKSILLEELDAQEALTQARADVAQATYDYDLAAARLVRAAGGSK